MAAGNTSQGNATLALELRGQVALARAICANDSAGSARIASSALRLLIRTIHGGEDPALPVAWPIQTDPMLSIVHREGMRLLERRNALYNQLEIALANAALREGSRIQAVKQRLLEEPSALFLLRQLQMREVVKLNQHTLGYEPDFQGLAGTNPYGIDYYAGDMTLESVDQWRTAMLEGQTWGASPVPEWDSSEGCHDNSEVRELLLAIELVEDEFSVLADRDWVSLFQNEAGFSTLKQRNHILWRIEGN